ncbi:MAG TPA: type II toxin-antitoxin system VapC family toxin [Longimicrobium sp.]|nr:type II toxin-antitoxin system VapC family toxin [Longimicrobium sp.]
MRLLLDTHVFLWFIIADPKLSARAEQAIRHDENTALLSIASVWEIAIKVKQGRLAIPQPLDVFIPHQLQANKIGLLPVELQHTYEIARLPLHHRDPFDRLLIAQAMTEDIPVVSTDSAFDAYPVQRLW